MVGTNGFDPESFIAQAKVTGKKVAITMVTFNRWSLTRLGLSSVFRNTFLPHTLTVVDNDSWDGTRERLKKLRQVGGIDRLILLPENRGIAVGKNFGLRASEGQTAWYCCIDNDIEVSPHWLSYLCYVSTLPGLGIIGSNVERFSLPGGARHHKATYWKTVRGVTLDNCPNPGGIYVVSAATLARIGYFAESTLYGMEDSEWFMRQKHYGLRSVYVRNAGCITLPSEEFMMKDGTSYSTFKKETHDAERAKVGAARKRGEATIFPHYQTTVTLQDVEEYTWRPQT